MDILDPLASPSSAPGPASFFHADSDSVRFWVKMGEGWMGAIVSRSTLHHRYRPEARDDDPLETHHSHLDELEAAVRKRVAGGSIEPVMIREFDLRTDAKPAPLRPL